jgi:hypothetical protein
MRRKEKLDSPVAVHLGETLKADLKEMAAKAGHEKLSTYIRQVLRVHAYGNHNPQRDLLANSVSDE